MTAVGAGIYNFYGPGEAVRRVQVKGELRPGGLVQLASGHVAMVLGEQLVLVAVDGRTTVLLGGSTSGWPISAGSRNPKRNHEQFTTTTIQKRNASDPQQSNWPNLTFH